MESEAGPDLVFEISVDPRKGSYVATARAFDIVATGDSMQELRINALDAVGRVLRRQHAATEGWSTSSTQPATWLME